MSGAITTGVFSPPMCPMCQLTDAMANDCRAVVGFVSFEDAVHRVYLKVIDAERRLTTEEHG